MKYLYVTVVTILFITCSQSLFAQSDTTTINTIKRKKMHGTFYVMWGYQKDYYTKSDVNFKNDRDDNYDFTLHNVKAHDRPDMHCLFNQPLTIPQYIFYGGYFFNNKGDWGIEGGWDHLKYIVTEGQTVHMTGQIHGVNYDQDTVVNYNFWHYEHTNGNNYLTVSLIKRFTFFNSTNSHHKLSLIAKAGGGLLIPKTQSVIMGNERDGPFRVAGYVFTLAGAVRYDIYRYFFLEASMKGGYAHYTHDKIYGEGIAKQHFFSQQFILSAGINIPLSKEK